MNKIFFFILLVIVSCRTSKWEDSSDKIETTNFTGIVHLNENGCPHFIEISNCLVSNLTYYIGKKVYPVQLEEKFRKEGLIVTFNLTISKALSPTDCQIDYVVSLENLSMVSK